MNIQVKKASGVLESFSEDKVRQSLKRAGAMPKVIDKILVQLIGQLHNGITTRAIYKQVFNLLNQYQSGLGYHYSLKDSLMQLGPSGYPFEKFITRLLDHMGYKTQTNIIKKGQCIEHEIDVLANKDNKQYLIECKFHNRPGTKTRSKDALYTQARFEDLSHEFNQVWLVT
ncbi:MAG: restriction endonuclease, partial [Patescibacteria group bacterium]|nr:restriction endonuclease [Patescibacteria group bacterium]